MRAAKNFGSDPTLTLRLQLGQIDIEILTLAKIFSLLLGAAVWNPEICLHYETPNPVARRTKHHYIRAKGLPHFREQGRCAYAAVGKNKRYEKLTG